MIVKSLALVRRPEAAGGICHELPSARISPAGFLRPLRRADLVRGDETLREMTLVSLLRRCPRHGQPCHASKSAQVRSQAFAVIVAHGWLRERRQSSFDRTRGERPGAFEPQARRLITCIRRNQALGVYAGPKRESDEEMTVSIYGRLTLHGQSEVSVNPASEYAAT